MLDQVCSRQLLQLLQLCGAWRGPTPAFSIERRMLGGVRQETLQVPSLNGEQLRPSRSGSTASSRRTSSFVIDLEIQTLM